MDAHGFDGIARRFAQRRLSRRNAAMAGGASLAAALGVKLLPTLAQESTPAAGGTPVASAAPDHAAFMFVQGFQSGSFTAKANAADGYTLTLNEGFGQTIFFSDRPERVTGALSTPNFLKGMSFSPSDPANAALVFGTGPDDTDVVVMELANPSYEADGHVVTYDAKPLSDFTQMGTTFTEAPRSDFPDQFSEASLFIDDCSDLPFWCQLPDGSNVGSIGNQGMCWHASTLDCRSCEPARYNGICNSTYPTICQGQCTAEHANQGIGALCEKVLVDCMGGPEMIVCAPLGSITMKGSWSWATLSCSYDQEAAIGLCEAAVPECNKWGGCTTWSMADVERCAGGDHPGAENPAATPIG